MSNQRIHDLLSAAEDGELSPAERTELESLLGDDPQAQEMQSELHRVDVILKKLRHLDAPQSLHGRIMRSVKLPNAYKKQPAQDRKSFSRSGRFTPSGVWRYGLATAAGMLLAVTFYESRPGLGEMPDLTELSGTMAPGRDSRAAQVLDTHAFRIDGLESRILLERHNGGVLLDIRVDADQPVEILVDFSSAGARLDGIAQSQNAPNAIDISPVSLRMQATGKGHLAALLSRVEDRPDDTNTITLEFSSNGRVLQRGSLAASW